MRKVSVLLSVTVFLVLLTGSNMSSSVKKVKIGKQVWMVMNLDVDKFRNGDPVPEAKTAEEWKKAAKNKQPVWCYYNNKSGNGEKYGKLYNWYAVIDKRGLAPKGWRIPSQKDWEQLFGFLGNDAIKMKTKTEWWQDGNGTNESGFSAQPGGIRYSQGSFEEMTQYGLWWELNRSWRFTSQ
jgi:uncharacterized protein (TIGR02145 family)